MSEARKWLEKECLPSLDGTVLFVGVAAYTKGYEKLVKDPRLFKTIDNDPAAAVFGCPWNHSVGDFLEFEPEARFDNIVLYGLDYDYTPNNELTWMSWAMKLLKKADSLLKNRGRLVFGGYVDNNIDEILGSLKHYACSYHTITQHNSRRELSWLGRKQEAINIVRNYSSYSEYIKHQKESTLNPEKRKAWLGKKWDLKLKTFTDCFIKTFGQDLSGKKCIGIGARTGQEVRAFRNLGAEAVGIDLVPCEPLVIEGDMHNIPFGDNSFDIAFSNSIDHSLYPEKFIKEVRRILKPNGLALLHLQLHILPPYSERAGQDVYDICDVNDSDAVIELFGNDTEVLVNKDCSYFSANWEILLKVIKQRNNHVGSK